MSHVLAQWLLKVGIFLQSCYSHLLTQTGLSQLIIVLRWITTLNLTENSRTRSNKIRKKWWTLRNLSQVWNLQPNDPMQNEIAIKCVVKSAFCNFCPDISKYNTDDQFLRTGGWSRWWHGGWSGRLSSTMALMEKVTAGKVLWYKIEPYKSEFLFIWFYCLFAGYDLALLQLYPIVKDGERFPKLKPVCLPFRNMAPSGVILFILVNKSHIILFKYTGNLLVSGFGKRKLPHCITDVQVGDEKSNSENIIIPYYYPQGPEKFGICGRPLRCTHDHRAVKWV